MSDTYQAIYDAVRSRISGGNVGEIVADAARNAFDISHAVQMLQAEISTVAYEHVRPFVLLKPKCYKDGDSWCALYGENIQEGVCAFGKTPAEASYNFDKEWNGKS